jgi:RND family efflux transporter MFP subunit
VLFWVGQPRPLRVVSEVNEEDVPRVAPGQSVLLRNDGFPQGGLTATVGEITPKGDPVAKTFRVYLLLPETTPLRIGMSVEANILISEKPDALLVPVEALRDGAVFVVRDGLARRQPVRTGIRGTGYVEVVEGLSVGEQVIAPVPPGLGDGEAVRLRAAAGR